jgi:hypothetical protein
MGRKEHDMTNPFSISSSVSDTEYTITLTQTDSDSAILDLWKSVEGDESDETYNLVGVTANGASATCQTQVLFMMATIGITVGATEVDIVVSHVLFAPTIPSIPISAADSAALLEWLKGFPEGTS